MHIELDVTQPVRAGIEVLDAFLESPGAWLPDPARRTSMGGWDVELEGLGLHRDVRLNLGPVWLDGDGYWRSLRWEPMPDRDDVIPLETLLPVFVGELGLLGDEQGEHELRLNGTYQPPGGPLGGILDHVGLHRVAVATAQRLLAGIATRLETIATHAAAR